MDWVAPNWHEVHENLSAEDKPHRGSPESITNGFMNSFGTRPDSNESAIGKRIAAKSRRFASVKEPNGVWW